MAKGEHLRTHGKSNLPEYKIWRAMIERCERVNCPSFKDYGARGIKVSEEWRKSFTQFLVDMGSRPPGHSLEREDVNGMYCKSNCKWIPRPAQARNRRDTKYLTHNGVTKPLAQWAEDLGIKPSTLQQRIYTYKWDVERALTT